MTGSSIGPGAEAPRQGGDHHRRSDEVYPEEGGGGGGVPPERRGGTNEIAVSGTELRTNRSAGRAFQRGRAAATTMPTTEKKPVNGEPGQRDRLATVGDLESTPTARANAAARVLAATAGRSRRYPSKRCYVYSSQRRPSAGQVGSNIPAGQAGGSPPTCANVLLTIFHVPSMRHKEKKSRKDTVPL